MGNKRKPDPAQLDLLKDRAHKIRVLRDFTAQHGLQTTSQKAMLMLLELHIGRFNGIELPIETIARQLLMSVKRAYGVAAELRKLDLIGYVPSRKDKVRFWIGWGRLQALYYGDDEQAEVIEEPIPEAVEATAVILTHENSILMGKKSILTSENNERLILTHENSPFSISDLIPSTSSSTQSDRFEAVVKVVKEARVHEAEATVRTALANGLTLDQIEAVVAHYAAFPNRWSVGVLVHRLTKLGAHRDAPHEGWFGERPEWKAAQAAKAPKLDQAAADNLAELEAAYGAELDGLTDDALAALAADSPRRLTARDRYDLPVLGRSSRDLRPRLLRALADRAEIGNA